MIFFVSPSKAKHRNFEHALWSVISNSSLWYNTTLDWEESLPLLQDEDWQDECQGTVDKGEAGPAAKTPDVQRTAGTDSERFLLLCADGTGLHECRPHAARTHNSSLWIHKPREKTAVVSRIPLLPHLIRILQKYERDPELRLKGKLLPAPSNQKMNAYLKEIADICLINKNLTVHPARHWFQEHPRNKRYLQQPISWQVTIWRRMIFSELLDSA